MDILAAMTVALATLLFCWPFIRAKQMHPAVIWSKRMTRAAWGRESQRMDRFKSALGSAQADLLCQHAGRPFGLTGTSLLQFQFIAALLFFVLFISASLFFAVMVGGLAWFMPRVLLSSMAGQRRAQIALELPAFLDIWGLLVTSGEGVETALYEICRRHPNWLLATEVRRALDRVAASGLFGESLVEEAKVTGSPEFVGVAEQISHLAEGGGVPSRELARMAELMREQRAAELAQSAGAMAVVGIFPKMFAFFLSLAPVIVTIILTVKKQL